LLTTTGGVIVVVQLTRIALLLAANGALLLASNADGKTPLTGAKPRFKVALEEAAQRFKTRKATSDACCCVC
jgi:hypothetical protein